MYRCENWTIKKAEYQRTSAFKLWCWKRLESPLDCKEIKPVNPKGNQHWIFTGRTDPEAEAPILWPPDLKSWLIGRPWCWERLKAEREEGNRGWDGWVASLIQWTWTWENTRKWWGTGRPGVLPFIGSQRVSYDWVTEEEQSGPQPRCLRSREWLGITFYTVTCILTLNWLLQISILKPDGQ